MDDCPKCEICHIEYICSSCYFEFNVFKCFICILDDKVIPSQQTAPIQKSVDMIQDDENIIESEPKLSQRPDEKLRKMGKLLLNVANMTHNSNKSVPITSNRINHYKLLVDLTADSDSDEEYKLKKKDSDMTQIGKGYGVVYVYQTDIECLRSDPGLSDRAKYMTSHVMDFLISFETEKLPLIHGRDIVIRLPASFWEIIQGPDPTYSAFLGGKTPRELNEFMSFKIHQFDIFRRNHISIITIFNLHNVLYPHFNNLPSREVKQSL